MKVKNTQESLSAGFWLPCGRASFVNTRTDRELIRALVSGAKTGALLTESLKNITRKSHKQNPLECSVLHRLSCVLTFGRCGFDKIRLVKPEYIQREINEEDDPEGLYAYASEIVYQPYGDYGSQADQKPLTLRNIHFVVDHNGFYFCWLTGEQDPEVTKKKFEGFLIDLLQGWETLVPTTLQETENDFPYSVNVEDYAGILTFSQLKLIIEGLNNYLFDPDVFFEHKKENLKDDLKEQYGLHSFFDSIVTPLELSPAPEDNTMPELGINSLLKAGKGKYNVIEDVLRQFLIGTSTNIQSLKWAVEKCRRHLLNEVISEAHRRNEILQIRTIHEEKKQPNSALLKGYVMFLGAKMPILLNVHRHLKAVQKEGTIEFRKKKTGAEDSQLLREHIEAANLNLSELFYSWSSLVHGLNDNVLSIDHAIAQSRQDRILHEQEQIRAEQEASAEAARMNERSGTSSISMDEEASARGANLLALLSMLLAGAALLAQSATVPDPNSHFDIFTVIRKEISRLFWEFNKEHPLTIIGAIVLVFTVISLIGFVLQYFFNRILQLFSKYWRNWFGLEESYYYELDARIEEHIDPNIRLAIFEGVPSKWLEFEQEKHQDYKNHPERHFGIGKFKQDWWHKCISFLQWLTAGSGAIAQQNKSYLTSDLTRKYYRVERSRDDEALHKINFECFVALPKSKTQSNWRFIRIIITWMLVTSAIIVKYMIEHPLFSKLPHLDVYQWTISSIFVFWITGCIIRWWVLWKRECILCHFTYEFLYHLHSSENNKFVLREMRFVARDFQRPLDADETRNLKNSIINTLIGTWVDPEEFKKMKNRENEPITAFIGA